MQTVTCRRTLTLPFLAALAIAAGGCGASRSSTGSSSNGSTYGLEPFTHEQLLVEKGARLVVVDHCAACHLVDQDRGVGPSFTSLAGHPVKLADGRTVTVDERYIRESLLAPARLAMSGYDSEPMVAALKRLHLAKHPAQVAELAAFIEQVGPESG